MTNLINTLTSAISNTVLFTAAVIMAGLGFVFVGTLALFALLAIGVAMIASPFVARAEAASDDTDVAA
jgi:membrane protein implicated in regulation of membrane protease activity